MPTTGKTSLRTQFKLVRYASAATVRVIGGLCILLGLVVMAGWMLDIPRLRSVVAGAVEMKANTALAFMLAGAALMLFAPRRRGSSPARRRVAQALGAAVAAIGVATGLEYLLGWDLGIDEALVRDIGTAFNRVKGRMSPYSALVFATAGTALAVLPLQRLRLLVRAAALVTILVGLISLMGYLWGARELMTDDWIPPVAVHTAAGFLLLGVGLLVAMYKFEPRRGNLLFLLDPVERKIMASFAGALLLLIAMGGWTYRTAAESALHSRALAQSKSFRGTLAELQADVADAAFAQRTYLITGDAVAFERWDRAARQLSISRRLLKDSADRLGSASADLAALDQAVVRLAAVMHEGVRLYLAEGMEAARRFVLTGACTDAMAAVRAALVSIDTFEGAEEDDRETEVREGQRRTLQTTLLALVTAAAVLGGVFLAIRREMVARVNAERGLRRRTSEALSSHRFLESLVQNIPHMIFVKDARDLRFVTMNRAGERITGVPQEAFVGKSDLNFFPPQEAEHFIAKDREVLARGEVLDIPAEEIHGAGGQLRVLHTKKIPLYDSAGRPTHLVGISEDVTDLREKERQIQALNQALRERAEEVERISQARGAFLATMSHEIRTPMNGMLGMLELLGLSPLDEKQRQALYVVSESGQSLLRIIDDILDFSKIEAGRLELREEVASVAAILREVRNIHAAVASSKGLVISMQLDPALSPAMWVDPLRLRQVLNNLASNALKFTARGQVEMRVEVLAQDAGVQTLRFTVADTGAGISPEDQARLFEPFVQAGSAAGVAGGTGLGLVISRRLAELMGGTLEMRSAVGTGTTMTMVIPVRIASPELLPPPVAQRMAQLRDATDQRRLAPPVAEAEAEGTLVLLVDDHPVNRMLLEQQLNTLGYAVNAAKDGADALERWRAGSFGLVITDCQMPGLTGYELARRIREHEAATGRARTPVVAFTAHALPEERDRCLRAGMDDVLFKPVELRTLMERLDRWLPLPAQAGGVVDLAFLAQTWGGDPQTLASIVGAFGRSAREDSAALRDAVASRDFETVTRVAHRMLGAAKMVGAYGLADSCERVNAAGRAREWEALLAAMQEFEGEYLRLLEGLPEPPRP